MNAIEGQAIGMGLTLIVAYVGLILYIVCQPDETDAAQKDKDEENHDE